MITVITKRGFTDTWDAYLRDWGGEGQPEFDVRTYEDLATVNELQAGPIVFCDIERLTDVDRALATDVARVVSETRPDIPILNNPTTTLRRYDLLNELHGRGLNPFRVYRLTDTTKPDQFPVFLRYENDHTGATTGLLYDQEELERAIVRAKIRRHNLRELIIVEYVDTRSGDERYMKYGAFKVGNIIVARHAHTGIDWVLKFGGSFKDAASVATEFEHVRDNPHVSLLRDLFTIGGVGYGRIDYSMLDDAVVTWEINTNPTIMSNLSDTDPASYPRQDLFVSRLNAAFDVLQSEPIDPSIISLGNVSQELRISAINDSREPASIVRHFGRRYKRWLEPAVRAVEFASIPFQTHILERWQRSNNN